ITFIVLLFSDYPNYASGFCGPLSCRMLPEHLVSVFTIPLFPNGSPPSPMLKTDRYFRRASGYEKRY
ncbi:hypothetical protein, partial [Bacteroides heparinolyticus]|uniref:hypothetical protein n=1 Tax=Prevotella heparinolytica TaxID=28113 RepID=UPI0035A1391B